MRKIDYSDDRDYEMGVTVNGTFIQQGYAGLVQGPTGTGLQETLRTAYPKGAIVQVNLSTKLLGMMPLCKAQGKYSTCDEILKADGTCPSVETHIVEAEVEVPA